MQHLADKAKLLRKEAKGIQHMVMDDEVRIVNLSFGLCLMAITSYGHIEQRRR